MFDLSLLPLESSVSTFVFSFLSVFINSFNLIHSHFKSLKSKSGFMALNFSITLSSHKKYDKSGLLFHDLYNLLSKLLANASFDVSVLVHSAALVNNSSFVSCSFVTSFAIGLYFE
jgi:hypothetical protein